MQLGESTQDVGRFEVVVPVALGAVVFSFIVYRPTAVILVFFIPLPAPLFAVLYVAYSLYAARAGRSPINHEAHLWGAICGLLLTLILDPGAYRNLLGLIGG